MLTECARYQELKGRRTKSRHKGAAADRWAQLVSIADEGTQQRKQECLAPITKASGFWGVGKVQDYGFANEGWKYCKNLGTTATRNPGWEELRMKQNQLTLANKCCKDSINPISLSNLQIIQNWPHCEDHQTKCGTEVSILKYQPVSTLDLLAKYTFDKYGLIILRKFSDAEQLLVESTARRMVTEIVRSASEERNLTENANGHSPSLRPQSSIQPSRVSASSSPISTPSPPASSTLGQLPATKEGPSNRPASSENASSTSLLSLTSTKPSTPFQSPASTDTIEPWITGSNTFAAPLRKSGRLSTVPKSSYTCILLKTRTRRARPERLVTRDQTKVRRTGEDDCNCSRRVSKTFFQAIKSSQQMSGFEEITKHLNNGAQQDLLCLYHLRTYASWARASMWRQCASQSPLLQIPPRLISDLRHNARYFISLKRRRLSLPISSYNTRTLFEEHLSKRRRDMDTQIGHEPGIGAKLLPVTSLEDDQIRTPSMRSNVAESRPHPPTINLTGTCNTAYEAVICPGSAPTVLGFDDFRKRYLADTTTPIEHSMLDVQCTIHEFVNLPKNSRLCEELPRYYEILRPAIPPEVLSYAEFISFQDLPTNAILLATMEEAALVLMQGPLRIPILVPLCLR
jgi:hypothetical protein